MAAPDAGQDRVADLIARYRALTPAQQRRFCARLGLVGAPVAVLLARTVAVLGGLLGRGLPLLVQLGNQVWAIRRKPESPAFDRALRLRHDAGESYLEIAQSERLTRDTVRGCVRRDRHRHP
jgi:hypothetical protein